MSDSLNFNSIIGRRKRDDVRTERAMPSEVFQCSVFYGQPVKQEITALQQLDELKSVFNKKRIDNLSKSLDSERFVFPYYSPDVFLTSEEARNFLPNFVRQLIKDGRIPEDVLIDNVIDENKLLVGVVTLKIAFLERDLPEFKNF